MNIENHPSDVLLPIAAVCEIVARTKASIYRAIARGTFPRQKKLGHSSRWRRSEAMQIVDGTWKG